VKIPLLGTKLIPFGIFMKALGVNSDVAIFEAVCQSPFAAIESRKNSNELRRIVEIVQNSLEQSKLPNQKTAHILLGSLLKRRLLIDKEQIEQNEGYKMMKDHVLPHLGTEESSFKAKAFFLADMARQLILHYLRRAEQVDRDHLANKRVELAGAMLHNIFKETF
jgi:DNA-directed RNA polymerase subunit B